MSTKLLVSHSSSPLLNIDYHFVLYGFLKVFQFFVDVFFFKKSQYWTNDINKSSYTLGKFRFLGCNEIYSVSKTLLDKVFIIFYLKIFFAL